MKRRSWSDYCLASAPRSVEASTYAMLAFTAGSHERIAVVELFGRNLARLRLSLVPAYWTETLISRCRSTFSVTPRCSWKTAARNPSSNAIVTGHPGREDDWSEPDRR